MPKDFLQLRFSVASPATNKPLFGLRFQLLFLALTTLLGFDRASAFWALGAVWVGGCKTFASARPALAC